MADSDSNPDLIARLFPCDGNEYALDAIRMCENSGRYFLPQGDIEPANRSRESTVSLDDNDDEDTKCPGLQLSYNLGPKADQGFVIGKDRNRCDIVLPNLAGIGRRHCSLTFDAQRRLILRDFSQNGTIVTYDGKGGEKRHHFPWILSGGDAGKVKEIVINIQAIKFRIVVCKHETHPSSYIDNVDRFLLQANADDEFTFGALGIQSTSSTAIQSGALTPQTAIYISQEKLGSGHFSVVNRAWDVSTGLMYASKEILNTNRDGWREEGRIMSKLSEISHEHIVRFIALKETPSSQLILEYFELGDLEDQHKKQSITNHESLIVLRQSLDALTFIHSQGIAHRDIKPENILVRIRDPLHVKLSDFGLSKATAKLHTFCGTHLYAAPEIYQPRRDVYYTNAVDIWSLGVVVFRFAFGLPRFFIGDQGLAWCEKIIKELDDWDADILSDFLSTAMLILRPERRLSAQDCLVQALRLPAPSQSRCLTPTPSSYWLDQHQVGYNAKEKQALREGIGSAQINVRPKSSKTLSEQSTEIWNPPMQMEAEIPNPIVSRVLRKRLRSSDPLIPNIQSSNQGAKKLQVYKSLENHVRGLLTEGTDEHDRQNRVNIGPRRATRTPHVEYDGNTTLTSSEKGLPGVQITAGQIGQKSVGKRARSPSKQILPANEDVPKITDFDVRHVQMKVNDQVVLMRKEDTFLNATQIMKVARKNGTE